MGMTDTRELRRRLLPARLVVYFVLACGCSGARTAATGGSWSSWWTRCITAAAASSCWRGSSTRTAGYRPGRVGGGGRRTSPSLSRARTRLGADPLHMLFDGGRRAGRRRRRGGVFCCGLRVVSMDGSSTDVPNSQENDAYFGRPANGTRAGAFPQVRWLAAAESGTGALVGATIGPYTVGEQTLALDLLPAFGAEMLVLADRNFLSHTLARDVLGTGAHILWRASASFRLTPIAVLADGSYLAVLHPRRKADGLPITVRVIEYTVHTSKAGDSAGEEESSEVFALVTDLLDPEAYPALDLACAYPMRWERRDRDRAPQDRHGRGHGGAAQQRPRRCRPGDVGPVRGLPGPTP